MQLDPTQYRTILLQVKVAILFEIRRVGSMYRIHVGIGPKPIEGLFYNAQFAKFILKKTIQKMSHHFFWPEAKVKNDLSSPQKMSNIYFHRTVWHLMKPTKKQNPFLVAITWGFSFSSPLRRSWKLHLLARSQVSGATASASATTAKRCRQNSCCSLPCGKYYRPP